MKWYWTVRIYNNYNNYRHTIVETKRDLSEIEILQNFYLELTGSKMLIEGMSETKPSGVLTISDTFTILFGEK